MLRVGASHAAGRSRAPLKPSALHGKSRWDRTTDATPQDSAFSSGAATPDVSPPPAAPPRRARIDSADPPAATATVLRVSTASAEAADDRPRPRSALSWLPFFS